MHIEDVITLKDDEEVIAVLRSHWITRAGHILMALALICVPFFLMVPLFSRGAWGTAAFAVLVCVAAWYAFRQYFLWQWNAFIVTDRRVVDIDQRGFFRRTVSVAAFDRVQDVSFTVQGVSGSLFGYGSLMVQTTGAATIIELVNVADPKGAHHMLTQAMAAHRAEMAGALSGGPDGDASRPGGRERRISRLMEAASDLDPTEARAFMTAIGQSAKREPEPAEVPDLTWMEEDEQDMTHLQH
ncbi:MAG: hypothetical protein RLZZ324_398 [Candidatus Parcubacteria bacterium]|jgi:membrane protein YdbS with pleckstrin-like domain